MKGALTRHWCAEVNVIVAVKAAAWDSPSFEGIGFHGYERILDEDASTRQVFYAKDDARLHRVGEATVKNAQHDKAYLYEFSGAGPCEINGTGDNPRTKIEFKPFVRYAGDVVRWENVHENHSLAYGDSWSRKADILE